MSIALDNLPTEFLQPLVRAWLEKINLAKQSQSYKDFRDTSEQCMAFFSGSTGFLWEEKFRAKFIGGNISPKFRLSLNKAFELVALFGPVLYHKNPVRSVRPHVRADLEPEVVAGAMGIDPIQWDAMTEAVQIAQQYAAAGQSLPLDLQQKVAVYQQVSTQIEQALRIDRIEASTRKAGCRLMEQYLSYTPREQPNGGLEQAGEDAVTETLIKGRGLLWPQPYQMPGSNRKLTGCFYDSCDNLITDPDAKSINFGETYWVSREHLEPWWEVEKRFKLPSGTLKGKGSLESNEAQGGRRSRKASTNLDRQRGNTFDLIRWYEIWSIGGVGTRLSGAPTQLHTAFDDVVGDYAYICVAEGVPWPLNAPVDRVRTAYEDDVREMFDWPVPYYADQRWPFALLEFYREPGSSYPIAPMKPGLGELTFLSIIISHLAHRIWRSSRTILAVLESAKGYVKKAMDTGDDLVVLELKDIHGEINKVISEFQYKDVVFDVWRIVDRVFDLFDKRVGLSDLLYGMNPGGAASRSATDIKAKQEKLSIRPDYMSKKVDSFLSEAARMEKLCTYWSGVSGEDVRPLVGTLGARLWDQVIAAAEPETILREMDATTEGSTAKKPNKDRDAENLGQIYQPLTQQLTAYAQLTGDSGPLNELNNKVGEAIDQDMSGLAMGPWIPASPPGQEEMANAEVETVQADVEAKQQQIQQDEQQHRQEMRQGKEKHSQDMKFRQQDHAQKLKLQKTQSRMRRMQPVKAAVR